MWLSYGSRTCNTCETSYRYTASGKSSSRPPRVAGSKLKARKMARRARQKKSTDRASWLVPAAAVVIAIVVAFFFQHSTNLPGENLLDGDARLERLKPLRHRIDALVAGEEAKGDAPARYPASRFKGRRRPQNSNSARLCRQHGS